MAEISKVADLSIEGEIGVLKLNSPPVNALSAALRESIIVGMEKAIADDAIKAIVLICAGRTFIAGADISEFGKPPIEPSFEKALSALENSPKPVIAAIHGTALGGGLETALTCNYRIATPSAKCGLPEVHLGLLPGAGGTQRLPRVVGVQTALEMITSGATVSAKKCLAMGLVDEWAGEESLQADAIKFAEKVLTENLPLVKVRDLNEKVAEHKGNPEIFTAFRKAIARKSRGFDAPELIIQCIEAAVEKEFDEGMKVEAQLFEKLMRGDQSAAQRHMFFANRECWKVPSLPKDTAEIPVKKVGIIGAGTMGGGIAMNFATTGYEVVIVETKQEALDRGLVIVRKNYERSASKGRFTMEEVEARMGRITGTVNIEDLADVDLVIEAVFENMAVKKEIFANLDRICKPGAILASNTSALDINEIATATKRPEAIIGLHFFSPANVMKLLEVVRTSDSSPEVINTSMKIAKKIGKTAVLVGVCPGFVGNRILFARQEEAYRMALTYGVMPWKIDKVLYDFGMPMGAFAMADLAGIDIGWDPKTSKGETIHEVLCEMDRRGQKTKAGFYDYDDKRVPSPSPVVEKIVNQFVEKNGQGKKAISDEEILALCTYPMINEGAKILEEGIATRSSDIDVAWVYGYGWPVYRGGPMFYADLIGLDKVLAKLKEWEAAYGERFKPSKLLVDLVEQGKKFADFGK